MNGVQPVIHIQGPRARIEGITMDLVRPALIASDPSAKFTAAFKDGRWDGMKELYTGNTFPAGLAQRVVEYLIQKKYKPTIREAAKPLTIDVEGFPRQCAGLTLWKHQYDAAITLLSHPRGCAKIPTAGGKTLLSFALGLYLHQKYGWKTLLITSRKGLARQTAQAFREWSKGVVSIGQCGDGMKVIGDITVATASTMMQFQPRIRAGVMREGNHKFFQLIRTVEILLFDESQHTGSDSWFEIGMNAEKAVCRWAMSGTPLTYKQLSDMRMIGVTGPILFSVDPDQLITQGNAAKPKIAVIFSSKASGPQLPQGRWKMVDRSTRETFFINGDPPYADELRGGRIVRKGSYRLGIIENKHHNETVIRCVRWCVERGRQTLLICRRMDHFRILNEMLKKTGIAYRAISGDTETFERDQVKKSFQERGINVLLASDIMGEGENLKAVKAIVLAEGGKANTSSVQRIGRGMRLEAGDHADLWVMDIVPTCAKVLMRHGQERCKSYEREGYEVRLVEDWSDIDNDDLLPFLKWDKQ